MSPNLPSRIKAHRGFWRQCNEQPLAKPLWVERCMRRLGELLPAWGPAQLNARADALWRVADCMPPEEAADIASAWWAKR